MNQIEKWIIRELGKCFEEDIDFDKCIQSISWQPQSPYDIYTIAIRVSKKNIGKPDVSRSNVIEKAVVIGNYINCIINSYDLMNCICSSIKMDECAFGIITFQASEKIAVEHTSLTTAYPINMSTFRVSIIGDALNRYYKKHGAVVETHYLVPDTAQNIPLILKKYTMEEILTAKGKSDHVTGMFFCLALNKIAKFDHIHKINKMFGLVKETSEYYIKDYNYLEYTLSQDDIDKLCQFCLEGHLDTLSNAGITIDCFDYESEQFDPQLANYLVDSKSYLLNNISYYAKLIEKYDKVYSVLNFRQEPVIKEARNYFNVANKKKIVPIYCQDIVESEGKECDSIRKGRFHSIDDVIFSICNRYNVSECVAISSLKLLVLSKELNDAIDYSFETNDTIEYYIKLMQKYMQMDSLSIKDDQLDENDVKLLKMAMLSYSKFNLNKSRYIHNTNEFRTRTIVTYCIQMIETVYDAERINSDVLNAALQIVKNGFELLGIVDL